MLGNGFVIGDVGAVAATAMMRVFASMLTSLSMVLLMALLLSAMMLGPGRGFPGGGSGVLGGPCLFLSFRLG